MSERTLRIGVDGRELVGHPTGVGRYIGEVLRRWTSDADFPHTLTVFAPTTPPAALALALGTGVDWIVLPAPRGGTWWEQWQLPGALRRANIDVLFAGAYTAPLTCPCPFVVVIHDVSFTSHPEWFGAREGIRRRWLTRQTARRAAGIITVSEFSAREISTWLDVPREAIILASPGAPERAAAAPGPRDPVVLYVGSLFNRRQIPELIAGFAGVARTIPAARLVLVGDNRSVPHIDPLQIAAAHGVAGAVEWRAYVTDADLTALYLRARVFAFLSTYEGFGMTPLEALAHDVPLVLLDTEVAREIYGAGARLVTSAPQSIGAALSDLLTNDTSHHAQLAAGLPLLDRYSWARSSATIRSALERAALV